jgi:glutamate 5-kinase
LAGHDITVAQILLTATDTEMRRRYINARNTLSALLKRGVVPVINENDTVATEEIRVGDNDRLAARVAAMISADCLVLLSDIDGLYTADPRQVADASFIAEVAEITPEIEAMAGVARVGMGQGGMVTKLQAARIALQAGCHMAIADGRHQNALAILARGGVATWFVAQATPTTARKRWIAGSLRPAGSVSIDAGAAAALKRGKSLLPAGVHAVAGAFERGDAVLIQDLDGAEIARGLIAYSADEAARIMRHNSNEIETILGYRGREELIHRDDLVLG